MREINKDCHIELNMEGVEFTVTKIVNYYPYRTITRSPCLLKFERRGSDEIIAFEEQLFKEFGSHGDNHCALLVEANYGQRIFICFSDFSMYLCLKVEEK